MNLARLLYWAIQMVARFHNFILRLNDTFEYCFTDKELHFLVVGFFGLGLVFLIYPVFKWLARHHHEMVITWIYVFTLLTVITFAIEIGQMLSGTGSMELADIVFGLVGFLVMFAVFAVIRRVYHGIRRGIQKHAERKKELQEDNDDEIWID